MAVAQLTQEQGESGRGHEWSEAVRRPSKPGEGAREQKEPGADDDRPRAGGGRVAAEVVDLHVVDSDAEPDASDQQRYLQRLHCRPVRSCSSASPERSSLRDEPERARLAEPGAQVGRPPARGEEDLRASVRKAFGYLEPAHVGQCDVQQDEVRLEREGSWSPDSPSSASPTTS